MEQNRPTNKKFKSNYLKTIRPSKSNIFDIQGRIGLPRLTRLRVNFSDLRGHRFDHRFNCPDALCKCSLENESAEHFLCAALYTQLLAKPYLAI